MRGKPFLPAKPYRYDFRRVNKAIGLANISGVGFAAVEFMEYLGQGRVAAQEPLPVVIPLFPPEFQKALEREYMASANSVFPLPVRLKVLQIPLHP